MTTVIFDDKSSFFTELQCLLTIAPNRFDGIRVAKKDEYCSLYDKCFISAEASVIDNNGVCYKVSERWPCEAICCPDGIDPSREDLQSISNSQGWIKQVKEQGESLGLRLALGRLGS
jgi:hypothetical protein